MDYLKKSLKLNDVKTEYRKMKLPQESELLRIFISERDKEGHRPLYEAIVEEARRHGMAGATVLKGCLGYGAASRLHSSKVLMISEDLPLVVEIVDSPEKIASFLPLVGEMLSGNCNCLATLEKVRVVDFDSF